jgi:hypothetical protein
MLTEGGAAAPGREVRHTETFQNLFDGGTLSFI